MKNMFKVSGLSGLSLSTIVIIVYSISFIFASCKKTENTSLVNLVNPNIGSVHSRWFFYTPASVPFGMAKLGPSTNGSYGNISGWEAVGYDDRHTSIEGFACFHEFQVGGVLLMPITGKLITIPGKMENQKSGFRSSFSKSDEMAIPGYYSVLLKDYMIKVELTSTKRVGFQRYTFPKSDESYILFDIGNRLGESGRVVNAHVEYTKDGKINGYVITEPEYVIRYQPGAEVKMYFSAIPDKKPESVGSFNHEIVHENLTVADGEGAGLYLKYHTKENEAIEIKIGLSYTSIENAELNLRSEAQNLNFQSARKAANSTWENELGKLKIEGGSRDEQLKFYTGLYHALLGRGLASDVNGAYPKNDGSIGQIPLNKDNVPSFNFYNTDALWGSYWNLTQLWMMGWREYFNDLVQTHLTVYKDAGWLGDGLANSKFVSGVGTNMVGLVISSAYLNGIRNYDVDLAYEAALKNEINWENRPAGAGKKDLRSFIEKGYIPYVDSWENNDSGSKFSVSHSLEYCYSSYAVAQFAKALGKTDDYEMLIKLSENWNNYFDKQSKLLRPLSPEGRFIDNFDPLAPWVGFQEGNAFQYTFFVPHTPEKLIEKIGMDEFNIRLDSIFNATKKTRFAGGAEIDAFSGLKYLYNHGNQPCLHISWLFNFSGKPWLTQKWTREIMKDFYGTEGMLGYGVGQDEDQGQLGSWYVLASMGLFDVRGLTQSNPQIQFGSPLFDKITISLDKEPGNKRAELIIQTINNSPENVYVQKCSFNGNPVNSCFFNHDELLKGGKLVFEMGPEPNIKWGLENANSQ